ncbi:Benzoate 4-monooxygenase OS=Aspergillus niger GN=bphA PE=1 SV=1 [Rhizoctonia solani AG-1 IB]|uniref:Benzoate 4-monooxygenase n=2 Tax=Thanatephorus cucumeris (strain AG1-IB / isolate 7/3/14) TaxID=1108050 RepID=A0A0B7FD57_THACB|nr:Benzoate 4-monooxygenase OS=Aspergillus niger GN=bphA PE=1 SV=1 [Rhizoctonia solani AG-1 IB]
MFVETTLNSSTHYYAAAGALLIAYYLTPYFLDPHDYRRRFSGPWLASFSGSWLANSASSGRHYQRLLQLHDKYGKFVRIGPNHISIADADALEVVYGHSSGTLKSGFYDAFRNGEADIFNTREKPIHTIKRKRIANIFSAQNVVAFEPRVRAHIERFCAQLDMRCKQARAGISGFNWVAKDGRAVINSPPQFAYLTFDIISDLALGIPFGMIEGQKDSTPTLLSVASKKNVQGMTPIRFIAEGGKAAMALGSYPSWAQKLLLFGTPWHIPEMLLRRNFLNTTKAAVDARVARIENEGQEHKEGGVDLLDKLFEVKNVDGSPLTREEIDSEALVTLGAGSDTTANSLAAMSYYIAANPDIKRRLQQELDLIDMDSYEDVADLDKDQSENAIPSFEKVKNLPYLNACVKETLRLYSTVGAGLPRVVPAGKTLVVAGHTFNAGSVISIASYCTNRSSVWGSDADVYRPERWTEDKSGSLNKYFVAFSTGPR